MKKDKAELALTGSNFTQENIPTLLEAVNAKILALKGDNEKDSRISRTLGSFGTISDITDINKLREAYAYITQKVKVIASHDKVFIASSPSTPLPVYKEGGVTVEVWQNEILTQYKSIVFKEELAKLEKAKQILQDNLSQKDKLAASLQDIANLFAISPAKVTA